MSFKSKTQWMCQRDESLTSNNHMNNKERSNSIILLVCFTWKDHSKLKSGIK